MVIANQFLGLTRDENAEKTGLSAGTITNILKEFSGKIGNAEFESLTHYSRTLRENNMNLSDSIDGFHIKNLAQRLGIDHEKLQTFLTEAYIPIKESNLTPSELIQNIKKFVEFLKSIEMTPDNLEQYYSDHLNKKQDLEKQTKLSEEKAISAERETTSALKQNKVTLEKITNFEQIRQELEQNGVSVDDLPKLAKMTKTAQKSNWDNSKIIDYLAESENYERQIIENQIKLDKINKEIDEKENQISLMSKKITSNKQQQKKFESKIKTLKNQEIVIKASISTTTSFSLSQIKTIEKKSIESIANIQSVHLDSLNTLDKYLIEKSAQIIKKQKVELEEITGILDKSVSEMIQLAEKEGSLKALAPLHKILDSKGEAHEIYPSMITILERFNIWYQKQNKKSTRLTLIIEELTSIMKNHLNNNGTI
jgi:hypothetical protein